jgi:hypothetical protein
MEILMTREPDDAAIDEIISTCDGDLRSAVKVLLLVNEQLECELRQLQAATVLGGMGGGNSAIH